MKLRSRGNKLFKARKARDFTISMLANKTGFSQGYISELERDVKKNPSKKVMDKLAEALKVNISDLF
ncbi:helix-turn-helix domain-containing protein [Ruminiclostridium cellobioparum]|uniref:helix-turn-helix domain-containing protein n=1 Tax=Ruminiclostridium cellobioparum TaxID=29355 RepID=UPI0028AF4151|nr:helix-turn-helix transcriptional regulator [Ruminiclostridium cellobioparum]